MHEDQVTRSINLTSSLHFDKLADYRAAGNGQPTLRGQTAVGVDNGYGLQGNPTLHELQDSISRLENGTQTLLFSSGLTALTAVGVLFNSGDHWLMPDSVYGPMRRYAEYLKDHAGITYDTYNPNDLTNLAQLVRPETKLIHIETPSSVTFDVAGVEEVVRIARTHSILTSADNTWASGVLYKPLNHGVDISIVSLTKYAAGYSDIFMGSVTTNDKALHKLFTRHHLVHGYTVSPFSAMLVNRGLETLYVRLETEGANALQLIKLFVGNPNVTKTYYIDPETSQDFAGPNSLFSVELDKVYEDNELEELFSVLNVFKIGESWGGTRSLVLPFQPSEFANRYNPPQNTIVRFHSGLEDIQSQTADIEAFISKLGALR